MAAAVGARFRFDHTYLDLPVIQNDRTGKEFVRRAPANIALKYRNTNSLAAQILRRLRSAANTEWPEFDVIAKALNMTPSTLLRRLDGEGQTFQATKDRLRRDMAIDQLCHTTKSIVEIAAELGFTEPSSFHRAFKKWAGVSPDEYRLLANRR